MQAPMELFSGLVELNQEYHLQLNQEPPLEGERNPILLDFLCLGTLGWIPVLRVIVAVKVSGVIESVIAPTLVHVQDFITNHPLLS